MNRLLLALAVVSLSLMAAPADGGKPACPKGSACKTDKAGDGKGCCGKTAAGKTCSKQKCEKDAGDKPAAAAKDGADAGCCKKGGKACKAAKKNEPATR